MMRHLLLTRATVAALSAAALVTLSTKASHAEQFTLFDVTFDYTWDNAINASPSKSHYYVKESNGLSVERPDNWVSPVDYRNGKVHIHVEVLEKPAGGQEQGWALCYVGNAGSYGCPYSDYYTETGTYDREVDMTGFYNDDTIDWSKGVAQVDLVYTINDSGQGHVHFFPDLKDKTTPTKVRIAMVQLAKGSTFDPSQLPGGAGGAGGTGGAAGASGTAGAAGSAGGAGGNTVGGSQPAAGGSAGASVVPTGGVGGGATGGVTSAGSPSTVPQAVGLTGSQAESGCSLGGTPRPFAVWLVAAALGLGRARRRSRA